MNRLKNTAAYASFILIASCIGFLVFYAGHTVLHFSPIMSALFAVITAAIFAHPTRRLTRHVSNKYFFSSLKNAQDTIKSLSSKLSSTIKLEEVMGAIIDAAISAIRVEKAGIVLLDERNNIVFFTFNRPSEPANKDSLSDEKVLIEHLTKTLKPLVYDELNLFIKQARDLNEEKRLSEVKQKMKEIDASACIPLISKNRLISLIILGKKISGESYSKDDLELLETLSNQAAIAIENARLYNNMEEMVALQTKDITEQAERLKGLLEMRSEFLDVTSHQLRTPVSVIKGTLSLMKEDNFQQLPREQQLEFINSMYRKSEKLESIISDILSASEMDSDKFIIKLEDDIDIEDLLDETVSDFSSQAQEKNLTLEFKKPTSRLPLIKGSKRYLEHAIDNLVSNALRYTKLGSVIIEAHLAIDDSDPDLRTRERLMMSVKDTGIGIPKEALPKLFEKFVRAQNARDMYTDGSGLGLFIVRKAVNAHPGGKVWIESEVGKGSTFYISLPVHPPEPAEHRPHLTES